MGLSVLTCENALRQSSGLALRQNSGQAFRQGSGQAALANLLQKIIRNQQTLADAVGVELPFTEGDMMTLINNVHTKEEGIKLPVTLQRTMLDEHAFDMAVDNGYIQLADDGHLQWMLGSTTLLAYFLGRLFCGDYSRFSQRKGCCLWQTGDGAFPSDDLNHLFQTTGLKQKRNNRKFLALPEHYELIDLLFVMRK